MFQSEFSRMHNNNEPRIEPLRPLFRKVSHRIISRNICLEARRSFGRRKVRSMNATEGETPVKIVRIIPRVDFHDPLRRSCSHMYQLFRFRGKRRLHFPGRKEARVAFMQLCNATGLARPGPRFPLARFHLSYKVPSFPRTGERRLFLRVVRK